MKSVQDIIFSNAFQLDMDKAIARAVDRADAASLPKAYLASYDELVKSKPVDAETGLDEGSK
jgi:hypothetical protein